jgi:hypothetical protein
MSESLNLTTMTGLTIEQMYAKLDEQLPADAYKAIAGTHGKDGSELTDIDPNYATEVLNQVFGPCGLGWGYAYNPGDLQLTVEQRPRSSGTGTRRVCLAVLSKLSVWYKLVKPDGAEVLCQIDAGGASDNDDEAYAMKGAITYAIGNALSKIGWQQSVYLGKRSHKTVKAATPKPGNPVKAAAAKAPVPAVARPAAKAAAAEGEIVEEDPAGSTAEADEPMSLNQVLAYVIPTGNWKGKTFKEVVNTTQDNKGQQTIEFWALKMSSAGDPAKEAIQTVARRYLELTKSNHKIPAGDKVAELA